MCETLTSNGTFLLDEQKRERVKSMGVQIRLSRTDFHKEFWTPEIEKLINSSDYIKIDGLDGRADVFPRGRALKNKVYNDYPCPCSLITQDYDSFYHSHRILIMPDGSVNIWCPCMSLELANVLTDKEVTHDLLVEREKLLRGYLESVNMIYDSMEFMCNQVCDRFKVTNKGIFRDDELMKKF